MNISAARAPGTLRITIAVLSRRGPSPIFPELTHKDVANRNLPMHGRRNNRAKGWPVQLPCDAVGEGAIPNEGGSPPIRFQEPGLEADPRETN